MATDGHWVPLETLQFVNNLYLSLRADDPLELTLRRIFTEVLGKMMLYAECSCGMHLMANTIGSFNGVPSKLETDHLLVHSGTAKYLSEALSRRCRLVTDVYVDYLPSYVRHSLSGLNSRGLFGDLKKQLSCGSVLVGANDLEPAGFPRIQEATVWTELFNELNATRERLQKCEGLTSSCTPIDCTASHILAIPLGELSDKLPAGRLGTIFLWENSQVNLSRLLEKHGEHLMLAAKIIGDFLMRLFESHYQVTKETYLPSYKIAERKMVAIMFADIRDFTPTTEICRNFNLLNVWTKFMKGYCEKMCTVIQNHGGRVHSLAGDGIMALFGEYVADPMQAVVSAVAAAKAMCGSFDSLKQEFYSNPEIIGFLKGEYEPIEFRLGTGINFGPVVFDYFGAQGSRVYSPLGDHVNFAQRLEGQANRWDEKENRMRAPILVSRSAWRTGKLDQVGKGNPLRLGVKGKSYVYEAFEAWPEA